MERQFNLKTGVLIISENVDVNTLLFEAAQLVQSQGGLSESAKRRKVISEKIENLPKN